MSSFLAGRTQMGTSLALHIVFASLEVGLPVAIAVAHFLALRRNDAGWLRLAARLTRALTVLVVVGVVSGIVISIELLVLECSPRAARCKSNSRATAASHASRDCVLTCANRDSRERLFLLDRSEGHSRES
jgi:hypothetical protein